MLIREKMTKNVITVSVSDPLAKAEKMMQLGNLHHLPVLSGNKLSSVLAVSDIENFKKNHPDADADTLAVRDVVPANQRLVTIAPDVSIEQAVSLMQNNKIGSLPVMEDSKIVGIITLSDVLNTFVDLLWAKKSRVVVNLGSEPGQIADVTAVISSFNVEILRIVMFPRPEENNYETLISLDTDNTRPIVEKLQQKGYDISSYDYMG